MKSLFTLMLFILCKLTFANQIDELRTIKDVNAFLSKKIDKKFKKKPLLESDFINDGKEGYIKNVFYKSDIDKNNLTDLIIDGYSLVVILDKGKNHFEMINLSKSINADVNLISIDSASQLNKLIVQRSEKPKSSPDTLVYKFGGFIEFNPSIGNTFLFEKIKFTTSRCFGECPVFELTINEDKTATYIAILYNDKEGKFHGVIADKDFDELLSLLKYLQLNKLESKYAVEWTDDQTANTEVTYNSSVKLISDYGKTGTYGLSILYSKFFDWRKTIRWLK